MRGHDQSDRRPGARGGFPELNSETIHAVATADVVRTYCASAFRRAALTGRPAFPWPEEPHVAAWRRYAIEAGERPFEYLQQRIPQLRIPILDGVSSTDAYRRVVRRGGPFDAGAFGGSLVLERPACFSFAVHDHFAGALPVLMSSHRPDFETLVRALAWRSEPVPVRGAVNAQMVAGFINWDRLRVYRAAWEVSADADAWPLEMQRVARDEPWRFHDRFVLAGVAPYSGVSASALEIELEQAAWLDASTIIRIEHELTHYATKRLYGHMSVNLFDELIADCMGFSVGLGAFRARWFLHGLGLEGWPDVRDEGRVHAYRADLPDAAFAAICAMTIRAAHTLERLCDQYFSEAERGRFLLALTWTTLDGLASDEAERLFADAYAEAAHWSSPAPAAIEVL